MSAVYTIAWGRDRLRSKAPQESGTRHSSSAAGSEAFGTDSLRLWPVGSMKRGCGSLSATAVTHMRENGPLSIALRSQRGDVAHEYFSFQFMPVGLGIVCLFQGW